MLLREFIDPQPFVYHGSRTFGLKRLEGRPSPLVGSAVVFAATLFEVAVAMSGGWTDDDFQFGHDVDGKKRDAVYPPYLMEELRYDAFADFFNESVCVYILPGDAFDVHPALQDFEMLSLEDIEPISSVTVREPLEYLRASPLIEMRRYAGN